MRPLGKCPVGATAMQNARTGLRGAVSTTFVLLFCLILGCAGQAPTTRVVCGACEDPDQFVRLQSVSGSRDADSRRQLSHPIAITPDEWKSLLSTIRVQSTSTIFLFLTKKETAQPLFTTEHLEFLGGSLSRAFAEAKPDERVVFGLTERESATVARMTTGGWFVEGDVLHLVLANYRFVVTMPSIRELLTKDPLRPNTGRTFELAAGPHQTLMPNSRAGRSMLDPDPLELAIAYKQLLSPDLASPPNPAAHDTKADSEPRPTLSQTPASLEQRLDRLKRLRDRGLITEDDYREKKQRLLEGL